MRHLAMILVTACALVGDLIHAAETSNSRSASDEILTRLLIGTWHLRVDADEKVVVFGSFAFAGDGKFSSEGLLKVAGATIRMKIEGKWQIAAGTLIEEVSKSSHPEIMPVGVISKDQILRLEGDVLETRTEDGSIERFEKKGQPVAGDAELPRVYKYIFIDAGFSLRLNADHSYVYDYYFPFSIPDPSEKPGPPKEVGKWQREAKEIVLTSSTGQIRRLEIIRKDGKIVLIEHITQRVVKTYY